MNVNSIDEVVIPILKELQKEGPVTCQAVVDSLQEQIVSGFTENHTLEYHFAIWKGRILQCARSADIELLKTGYVSWKRIEAAIRERAINPESSTDDIGCSSSRTSGRNKSTTSSTDKCSAATSSSSVVKLTPAQLKWVKSMYDGIKAEEKWQLFTSSEEKFVEDGMATKAKQCVYHHPTHSLIMDPEDAAWKEIFTDAELQEIKDLKRPQLPELPANLYNYLISYHGKKDIKSLVRRRREADFDPLEEPDLYLLRNAIVEATDLYVFKYLPLQDHSESDLIHRIWGFVAKAFDGSRIKVQSGEKGSTASVQRKNDDRSSIRDASGKLSKKVMGTKVDLRFSVDGLEYGCAEAGLSSDMTNCKPIQEGRLKLPRSMKDIFTSLVSESPAAIRDIRVGGFLISGLKLTAYIMDSPAGKVCRITKVGPYEFPTSPTVFAKKFIPLVSLVWQMKTMMNEVVSIVENDDTIIMPNTLNEAQAALIPPCMPSPRLVPQKRAYNEMEKKDD